MVLGAIGWKPLPACLSSHAVPVAWLGKGAGSLFISPATRAIARACVSLVSGMAMPLDID